MSAIYDSDSLHKHHIYVLAALADRTQSITPRSSSRRQIEPREPGAEHTLPHIAIAQHRVHKSCIAAGSPVQSRIRDQHVSQQRYPLAHLPNYQSAPHRPRTCAQRTGTPTRHAGAGRGLGRSLQLYAYTQHRVRSTDRGLCILSSLRGFLLFLGVCPHLRCRYRCAATLSLQLYTVYT